MSVWKRGRQYWTDFAVAGQQYRKRLGTTNLQLAKKRERDLIENSRPRIGHSQRTRTEAPSEAIESYLVAKRMRCSSRTIELEEERLSLVKKHFGDVPLPAITASAIADFQRARHHAGIANRTINIGCRRPLARAQSCGIVCICDNARRRHVTVTSQFDVERVSAFR
jgi:hypothetical protein